MGDDYLIIIPLCAKKLIIAPAKVFKLQHTCTIKALKNVAKCPRKDAFSKPAYLSPTNGKL